MVGPFHAALCHALDELPADWSASVLFVADPGRDRTVERLERLVAADARTTALVLSRRFGQQAALWAGLEHTRSADAVVMMDGDLQHPPEVIGRMVDAHMSGADVVQAIREGAPSAFRAGLVQRVLRVLADHPFPENAPDFRLVSRRAADAILAGFGSEDLFLRGACAWIGYPAKEIRFEVPDRMLGRTKFGARRLLRYAKHMITGYSSKPLEGIVVVGVGILGLAVAALPFVLAAAFLGRNGWGLWLVAWLVTFGIGLNLTGTGVLGVYLAALNTRIRGRPIYLVDRTIGRGCDGAEGVDPPGRSSATTRGSAG